MRSAFPNRGDFLPRLSGLSIFIVHPPTSFAMDGLKETLMPVVQAAILWIQFKSIPELLSISAAAVLIPVISWFILAWSTSPLHSKTHYTLFSQPDHEPHTLIKRPVTKYYTTSATLALKPQMDRAISKLFTLVNERFAKTSKPYDL